jgi:adenine-specific DNA-methyltransferase
VLQNLLNDLKTLLSQDDRLMADGQLLKNKVIELGLALDAGLLKLLLSHAAISKHFFADVAGVKVFDKIKFQQFVSNKAFLPDSYTAFKNKIGLMTDATYLTDSKEVVLAWPYKDCVLEGGQTKEEAKRSEIFYNETLAPDQIDRLLAPKALTNFKRYDKTGAHKVASISKDDNLIIKGNNLLALHTLKRAYAGQVKLIYIDPPYNTGSDSFKYNDSFNHSSWLTFMRNRLEIAKELLKKSGLLWISTDDSEAHYLKVLCDEVLGRANFVADVIWHSTKSVTNTAVISDAHTHTLLYAKDIATLKANRTSFRVPADESKFSNPDNDPRGKWVADPFQVGGVRPNQLYEIRNPVTGEIYTPNDGCSWKNEKTVFDELMREGRIVFGVSGEAGPQRKRFWKDAEERGEVVTTLWRDLPATTNGTRHLNELVGKNKFSNPKPEGLIERILQLSTSENDLVLDFHLGSGTTAAVAHKMKRRYIGVEQMDYIHTVTIERLKKVIAGEQGGVSKSASWQGGGSFVYCELADANQHFASEIEAAKDAATLGKIWETMQDKAFLSYRINPTSINAAAADFAALSVDDQKRFLMEVLDKNMLYVPLSEIEDESYGISADDKKLNAQLLGQS